MKEAESFVLFGIHRMFIAWQEFKNILTSLSAILIRNLNAYQSHLNHKIY